MGPVPHRLQLSHLAFLTVLDMAAPLPAGGAGLLLFALVLVEFNDVAQFVSGRLLGRHAIAPAVSPNKTWEGFLGGLAASAALGALLSPWLTPFGSPKARWSAPASRPSASSATSPSRR